MESGAAAGADPRGADGLRRRAAYPDRDGHVRPEPRIDDGFHALTNQPVVGHALVRVSLARGRAAARIAAANALRSDYGKQEPADVRALISALADADGRVRLAACWALAAPAGVDRGAGPALLRMLRDARAHQRWCEAAYAASDLGEISDGYADAAADIVALAAEVPEPDAMFQAVTALASYPTAEGAAKAAWRILLRDDMSFEPVRGILDANPEEGLALALGAPDLEDPVQRRRGGVALTFLAAFDLSLEAHAEAYRRLLHDPDASVRSEMGMQCAHLAAKQPRFALPLLAEVIERDPDERVRTDVLWGLGAALYDRRNDADACEDFRKRMFALCFHGSAPQAVRDGAMRAASRVEWSLRQTDP